MAVAGLIVLALGLLLLLPRGFTGGSGYSRIAPISPSHIEQTPGYRESAPINWRRVVIGLILTAAGIILLVVSL